MISNAFRGHSRAAVNPSDSGRLTCHDATRVGSVAGGFGRRGHCGTRPGGYDPRDAEERQALRAEGLDLDDNGLPLLGLLISVSLFVGGQLR